MRSVIIMLAAAALAVSSCRNAGKKAAGNTDTVSREGFAAGTFGYDLEFLKKHDSVIVLQNNSGSGRLIVSPKYQGKVFTSTAAGLQGKSFGWVNYKLFGSGIDPHMNPYGGEDRLWLGPEGGKFSLYFKPGAKMVFENWHVPAFIDTEPWHLVSSSGKKVELHKTANIINYAGTPLDLKIDREIAVIENDAIAKLLNISLEGIEAVGFSTVNALTNTGKNAWTPKSGAPVLWSLDMFTPSDRTMIVVPYIENASGKVANTGYFGEIPADRISYHDGVLFFKADGRSRGKLGIPPNRAKNVAGSYDALNGVLTITLFDIDNKGTYLNQEWDPGKDPFTGDAVNAYNDGPLEDGKQMGPFYEVESVSPAAFLKPGEKMVHKHSVFHFTGDKAALDKIARATLGVELEIIEKGIKK